MSRNEKDQTPDKRQIRSGEGSFIAAGCEVDGTFAFSGPLTISGHMKGRITAAGLIMIEPGGHLEGTIEAAVIIVQGSLSGDVRATQSLEIWAGSEVRGKVYARSIRVDEGSLLTADLVISADMPLPSADPATPEPETLQPVRSDRPASPLPGSGLARRLAERDENQ